MNKMYKLINGKGSLYLSNIPGTLGGNKRLKIYGKLDCKSALRWIEKGYYIKDRVFFLNEEDAINAGYRPCSVCMHEKYLKWKKTKSLVFFYHLMYNTIGDEKCILNIIY